MGWYSSELFRGPLRSYSGYPMMDYFSEVRCCSDVLPHVVSLFWRWDWTPFQIYLLSSFILACICCPSSTCRVNLYKNWHLSHQSNPGIVGDGLIKLKSTALSGAAYWMAMRAAFPDILRFSFKLGPIPVLSFFFWWGFGSAEDWVVLGCTTKMFGALHCRAWAVVLLGSGLWTL